jgi:hypothetical protein
MNIDHPSNDQIILSLLLRPRWFNRRGFSFAAILNGQRRPNYCAALSANDLCASNSYLNSKTSPGLWPGVVRTLNMRAPALLRWLIPFYVKGADGLGLQRPRGLPSAIWHAAQIKPLWFRRPKNFQLGGFLRKLCRKFSQEQISDAGEPVVMFVRSATILRITLVKHSSQNIVSQEETRTLWSHQHMLDEEAICHPLRTRIVVTSNEWQMRIS